MLLSSPALLHAQESDPATSKTDDDRGVIDILSRAAETAPPDELDIRECDKETEAAELSGEIIVCRQRGERPADYFSGSREDWLKKYAYESRNYNAPPTPDVAGAGIFRGEPSISGLCFIPPCPEEPALLIDVTKLPPPPKESDAERIARGLPPRGWDGNPQTDPRKITEEELGLPPKPDFADNAPPVRPEE
ncbi:MAG: hypothetical protein SXU28_07190 [Pseudomonadota bacterium]|nr:hypothetical protein [Pseudomonadota bacterium]